MDCENGGSIVFQNEIYYQLQTVKSMFLLR